MCRPRFCACSQATRGRKYSIIGPASNSLCPVIRRIASRHGRLDPSFNIDLYRHTYTVHRTTTTTSTTTTTTQQLLLLLLLLLHLFNGLFSVTIWVSRYQNGKTSLDLNMARDDWVLGCSGISWTTCKQPAPRSRQITTPTPHQSLFTGRMLFPTPNQQCQSTVGKSDN